MTWKTIKVWIMVLVPVVMVGVLFALRGTLVRVGSEGITHWEKKKFTFYRLINVMMI